MQTSYIFDYASRSNVGLALALVRPHLLHNLHFLIRSLDSTKLVTDISAIFRRHGVVHNLSNGNIVLPLYSMDAAMGSKLFTGFDEVWVIAADEAPVNLASLPWMTTDGDNFKDGVPSGLCESLISAKCVLALGDGTGLNIATTSVDFYQLILNEQLESEPDC